MVDKSNDVEQFPEDAAIQLTKLESTRRLIESALDSYRAGDQKMEAVETSQRVAPIKLPAGWFFALIPSNTDSELVVESLQRAGALRPYVWTLLGNSERNKHIRWTRDYHSRPVFIGNQLEIDYDDQDKTSWIYSEERRLRAAYHLKGFKLARHTIEQINNIYALRENGSE